MVLSDKKIGNFTVVRKKPINLDINDSALFEFEYQRTFKSPKIYLKKNIYVNEAKLKKFKFFRIHSNHWRMSNFWVRYKIKFFLEDLKIFINNLFKFKKEIIEIEKAAWVTDQKSWKYMHWFSDALQRIELIKKDLNEYPILIDDYYLNFDYTIDILKILEIPYIVLERKKLYRVKKLLIASHVAPAGNYNEEIINSISGKIKNNVKNKQKIPFRKLWISRENAKIRNIVNIGDVKSLIKKYDYEIVFLENLTTKEQINIINESIVIAGLQGAGLNNILYMNNNTNVLEVRDRKDNHNNCYYSLSSALEINFYYALADSVEKGNFHSADYVVDIKSLEEAFKEIEKNLND